MGHGSLLKFPSTRAAFALPGPAANPFPDFDVPMPPSDSLPPSATAPVPLANGLPRCGRWFYAPRGRRHVRPPRAVRRSRVTGSPSRRDVSRRGEGLPGYGTVLFVRAMVEHPAGDTPLLAQKTRMQGGVVAFRYNRTLGLREDERFRGRLP